MDPNDNKIIDGHELTQIYTKLPDRTLMKFEFLCLIRFHKHVNVLLSDGYAAQTHIGPAVYH